MPLAAPSGCFETCALHSLQDFLWAASFYSRFFLSYLPFYSVSGALLLFVAVRYGSSEQQEWGVTHRQPDPDQSPVLSGPPWAADRSNDVGGLPGTVGGLLWARPGREPAPLCGGLQWWRVCRTPPVQMRKPRPRSGLSGELDMAAPKPPHRVLESHWFVWITQMNHIPKEIGHEKHRDWASSQVGSRGGWRGRLLGWVGSQLRGKGP